VMGPLDEAVKKMKKPKKTAPRGKR
jgi:hypothetical protein